MTMPVPSFEDPPRRIDGLLPDFHGPAIKRAPEKALPTGAGEWLSYDAACEVRHVGNVRTDRGARVSTARAGAIDDLGVAVAALAGTERPAPTCCFSKFVS